MAFPSVISKTATTATASSTTHAINMPATTTAGRLLIISGRTTGTMGADPSGWTLRADIAGAGTPRSFTYTKTADGTEGGTTVTVNTSAAAVCRAWAIEVSNWVDTEIFSGSSGSDRNISIGAAPTWGATPDTMLLGLAALAQVATGYSFDAGSGWTADHDDVQELVIYHVGEFNTALETWDTQYTAAAGTGWSGVVLAIEGGSVTPADLTLSVAAGVATATLALHSKTILSLAPTDGVATAQLALKSPHSLGLGQVDGVATATLELVDNIVPLAPANGVATALLELRTPARLSLAPTDGIATAQAVVHSGAPLVLVSADGSSTALLSMYTPVVLTLSSLDGVATATLVLDVLFRARLRMGGGVVVLKKSSAGVVVKTRNQAGVVVRGAKLGAGYVV